MAILPGWNSLDAVGSIGHNLHLAAMVVLALLIVAEAMALVYDDRKSALIAAADRDIIARFYQGQRDSEKRHDNEVADVQRRLEETQREQASRQMTIADQQALLAALSPFPGQQIDITSPLGDLEAQQFASEFASVTQQAGWNTTGVNEAALATNPTGVEVLYREPPPDNVPPPALSALVDTLVGLHILPARSITICEELASDVIRLVVGTRPASSELHSSLLPEASPLISRDSNAANPTASGDTPLAQ
jgi:hypothetical protein